MSDKFHEQISEFIDDEMSIEESEFFVRRLQRDESAREQYLRYLLIGAAVRGEYLHPGAEDLGRRLEQALDNDEIAQRGVRSGWARLASGAGIAASVALVAVLGLRYVSLGPDAFPGTTDADESPGQLDPPSYVVPEATASSQEFVRVQADLTGIQYLIQHARYSPGMSRTIMQSSMIAAQEEDPAIESVEEDDLID